MFKFLVFSIEQEDALGVVNQLDSSYFCFVLIVQKAVRIYCSSKKVTKFACQMSSHQLKRALQILEEQEEAFTIFTCISALNISNDLRSPDASFL